MFRIRTYFTNLGLGCFDLTITALCYSALLYWGLTGRMNPARWRLSNLSGHSMLFAFALVLWIALSWHLHLYDSRRMDSPFADARTLLKIGVGNWIGLEGLAHFFPNAAVAPHFIFDFEALNVIGLIFARALLRLLARELRRRGRNVKRLLLVATPAIGKRVAEKLEQRAHLGYRIIERLPHPDLLWQECPDLTQELERTLKSVTVDDVIIALPAAANTLVAELAAECESRGVNVRVVPDLLPLIRSDTQVYDLDGIPLVNVRRYPTDCLRYAVLKRAFDVAASTLLLLLFSPFYVLIAILVKWSSPGPVHFVQERVGLNGRKFKMLKFRTMRGGVDPETHWTIPNDPHVTTIGHLLRRSNLDEIPQFLNVLKGDMSIVGPRPERPHFQERFRHEVPEYMARHYVKSGITGWAQVNGWRGDTSISQRVACDLYYIRNWAFALDLKIVLLTVLRTFFHPNAY